MDARDGHCWPVDIGCDLGTWLVLEAAGLLARGEREGIARHCSSRFFIASLENAPGHQETSVLSNALISVRFC